MIKFYNTLTARRDPFVPLEEGKVKMYACGPTVYNFFHVGNARCFVIFDMLRRYLEYRGYDSSGISVFTDGEITTVKAKGKITEVEKLLSENFENPEFVIFPDGCEFYYC